MRFRGPAKACRPLAVAATRKTMADRVESTAASTIRSPAHSSRTVGATAPGRPSVGRTLVGEAGTMGTGVHTWWPAGLQLYEAYAEKAMGWSIAFHCFVSVTIAPMHDPFHGLYRLFHAVPPSASRHSSPHLRPPPSVHPYFPVQCQPRQATYSMGKDASGIRSPPGSLAIPPPPSNSLSSFFAISLPGHACGSSHCSLPWV